MSAVKVAITAGPSCRKSLQPTKTERKQGPTQQIPGCTASTDGMLPYASRYEANAVSAASMMNGTPSDGGLYQYRFTARASCMCGSGVKGLTFSCMFLGHCTTQLLSRTLVLSSSANRVSHSSVVSLPGKRSALFVNSTWTWVSPTTGPASAPVRAPLAHAEKHQPIQGQENAWQQQVAAEKSAKGQIQR